MGERNAFESQNLSIWGRRIPSGTWGDGIEWWTVLDGMLRPIGPILDPIKPMYRIKKHLL